MSVARLQNIARMGALNVQAGDEDALTEVFLPHLLPKHWHGQAFLPAGQAAGGPQPDWFCLLWRKLKVVPVSTMKTALQFQADSHQSRSLNVSMPRHRQAWNSQACMMVICACPCSEAILDADLVS